MGDKHIDVKIKSWGNGSSSGPWVKFDLAGEDDLESLKSKVGEGFHMILVPIDSDEKPGQEYEAVGEEKKKSKLSNEAFFMVNQENFGEYLASVYQEDFYTFEKRDNWLKEKLSISSKSELDRGGLEAVGFESIRGAFREWVNS